MYNVFIVLLTLPLISGITKELFNRNDYDAFGDRLAVNENLAIFAENDYYQFTIMEEPFSSNPITCTLYYSSLSIWNGNMSSLNYVYNIVMGTKQNESRPVFAVIGEDRWKKTYLLVVILRHPSICITPLDHILWRELDSSQDFQAFALGINPYGTHAYVVQLGETLYFDIVHNKSIKIQNKDLWDRTNFFYSRALVVTDDHYLFLVAYQILADERETLPYLYSAKLSDPFNPIPLQMKKLSSENFIWQVDIHTRHATLSISIHEQSKMMIVGVPHLDTVFIVSFQKESLNIIKEHVSPQKNILFGKSVAMLDSNTYSVLVYLKPTLPWSSSQIQTYFLNETIETPKPLFVFPNNQQEIEPTRLQSLPHRIVSLMTWNSHSVGLVVDAPAVILIPASLPGYYSAKIEKYGAIAIYKSISCIPSTHQVKRSFGPCMICPLGSKNDGSAGEMCVKCTTNDTLWCFSGAIHEIDMTNITSYDQANPYPESLHTTEFDDILLQNIFQLSFENRHCVLVSPLFWTCVAVGCCIMIFIMIQLLSRCSKSQIRPQFFEKLFSHFDVISEGKHWLGGLISLSLLVLITFVCEFSISFAHLYPIEETSFEKRQSASCDDRLLNAKLTSSLQLLSTLEHDNEKPIFTLLNEQNITLIVQFISTGYTCENVILQQNRDRGLSIPFTNFNCLKSNGILTITTLLPQHVVAMQFNLNGPHFVGGLRLCFSAPSVINTNAYSKVQQMNTCQFFYTPNQTLTRDPTVNVKMTKVINRTAGLTIHENTTYTGIWLPSFTVNTLSDELLFSLGAEYLRYVPKKTTLVVVITESEFYMKNTQEPIARQYEIVFSTVLFASKSVILSNDDK